MIARISVQKTLWKFRSRFLLFEHVLNLQSPIKICQKTEKIFRKTCKIPGLLKPHQSSRRHVQYIQHLLCLDWIPASKAKFLFQLTTLNPKILIELKTHLCYTTVFLGGEYSN